MNGITIMNGTALGKGEGQQNDEETINDANDDTSDATETPRNTVTSTSDIQTMQFSSAPTTKCRVRLKDVIDLVGTNNHDIKLLRVSTIESRY